MRLWTLIKLVVGTAVFGLTVFTGLLVFHVHHEPMGGIFARLVPVQLEARPVISLPEPSADLPDVDPGAKIFERARELIALGEFPSAREKLHTLVYTYPRSKAAPEARRILGEMNLDELLSTREMTGKSIHIVRPGEHFIGIATKYNTTLECVMHLNGLLDLKSLHPGEELIVLPLNLRVIIEPSRRALSLWDEGRFIKEYTLLSANTGNVKGARLTKIASKAGLSDSRRLSPEMKAYRESEKIFTLENMSLKIHGPAPAPAGDDGKPDAAAASSGPGPGFILSAVDAEELCLLLRPGNEVEIRASAP